MFSWLSAPPFASPTSVVIADVIAPLSYGSGFEALLSETFANTYLNGNDSINYGVGATPSAAPIRQLR